MNPDNLEIKKKLIEHGMRPTRARCLVMTLLKNNNGHLSTEGIIRTLRKKGYPVSVATLYQNLNKLVESGLLTRIKGTDGLMRFDANLAHHHHLTCENCGRMVDVKIGQETLLAKPPFAYHTGNSLPDWQIDHIKIEFKGICPVCRENY
jgi:Fe2+ or Zn2+ uptake regulation protein